LSSTSSICVLWNVISGHFSTSKKSALRRWSSRCWFRVSTLAVLSTTVAWDLVMSSTSAWNDPSISLKDPRTVVTMA
jgi:hypothetical protein